MTKPYSEDDVRALADLLFHRLAAHSIGKRAKYRGTWAVDCEAILDHLTSAGWAKRADVLEDAVQEMCRAINFYDTVLDSPLVEREPVGQDHINRVIRAGRRVKEARNA